MDKKLIKYIQIYTFVFVLSMFSRPSIAAAQCQQQEQGWGASMLEGYNDLVNAATGRTNQVMMLIDALNDADAEYKRNLRELNRLRSIEPSPETMSAEERSIEMYIVKKKIAEMPSKILQLKRMLSQANKDLGFSFTKNVFEPFSFVIFYKTQSWHRALMGIAKQGITPAVTKDLGEALIATFLYGDRPLGYKWAKKQAGFGKKAKK